MPDPSEVGLDRRAVRADLVVDGRHRVGIGERPQDGAADVARQQLRAGEHHDAQQGEGQQAEAQPLPGLPRETGRHFR